MNLFVRIGDYSKQFFLVVLFFLSIFLSPYSRTNSCSSTETQDQSLLVQNASRVFFILSLVSIHLMVDPVY